MVTTIIIVFLIFLCLLLISLRITSVKENKQLLKRIHREYEINSILETGNKELNETREELNETRGELTHLILHIRYTLNDNDYDKFITSLKAKYNIEL